jgi:signal transduction histidine kinase
MLDTCATMDRFLHAERLRLGKMPVKPAPVDLAVLLHQLVRNLSHQMNDHSAPVDVSVAQDVPPTFTTDADVVTIILQNLASNALKYASGKPVHLRAVATESGGVRISVIDEGPGISPEQMCMLFTPFQRGETHGQKGTGLGLTIAHQAADLLGAKLRAESEPGKGTVFHLELPGA